MKKYVPGCLGMILGPLAALGLHFAVLKPLGINNAALLTILMAGGMFGGMYLGDQYRHLIEVGKDRYGREE